MHWIGLVDCPEHVCCRYRLAAFRPFLERAGHTLELMTLPCHWWSRVGLFQRLRDANVIVQRRLLAGWQRTLLRRAVRRLVFDFDDAVFLRDSYAAKGLRDHRRLRRFAGTVRCADAVAAVDKIMGSAGWVNAVRAAWMVLQIPPAKSKLLLPIKSNLFCDAPGFEYNTTPLCRDEALIALAGSAVDADARDVLASQLFRVAWLGRTNIDADEALAAASRQRKREDKDGDGASDTERAEEWLSEFLAVGPVESNKCAEDGNSALGVRRGRKWWRDTILRRLGGKTKKHGFGDGARWYFTLPGGQWPPHTEESEESVWDSSDSSDSSTKTPRKYEESQNDDVGILREDRDSSGESIRPLEESEESEESVWDSSQKPQKFTEESEESEESQHGKMGFFGDEPAVEVEPAADEPGSLDDPAPDFAEPDEDNSPERRDDEPALSAYRAPQDGDEDEDGFVFRNGSWVAPDADPLATDGNPFTDPAC